MWRVELYTARQGHVMGWRVVRGKWWPFKETAASFRISSITQGDPVITCRNAATALCQYLNACDDLREAFDCEPLSHPGYSPFSPRLMKALDAFNAAQIERMKHGV